MSSFSPGGALGGPGEARVKFGGKETTLGAFAPTRGLLQKIMAPPLIFKTLQTNTHQRTLGTNSIMHQLLLIKPRQEPLTSQDIRTN